MSNTDGMDAERNAVLAYLDGLSDEAAAHIFPSDLEKCQTSECSVEVCSVRAGNPDEHTVPLFSREQVVDALAALRPSTAPAAGAEPVATVIKTGAERQFMSERLGHLPDGIYSLYLAHPVPVKPAEQPSNGTIEEIQIVPAAQPAGVTDAMVGQALDAWYAMRGFSDIERMRSALLTHPAGVGRDVPVKPAGEVVDQCVIYLDTDPIDVAQFYRSKGFQHLPPTPTMTGAEIRACGWKKNNYQMYIDVTPMVPVGDTESIPLEDGMKFFCIPPATW
ncbi:MAG: hypothetical protein V4451_16265 [Pseudomonadota bacterium]